MNPWHPSMLAKASHPFLQAIIGKGASMDSLEERVIWGGSCVMERITEEGIASQHTTGIVADRHHPRFSAFSCCYEQLPGFTVHISDPQMGDLHCAQSAINEGQQQGNVAGPQGSG